ncbi:uncharacterized protein [Paramisgurnus dabryanus]|uniref:uncharacterized protein n=1 Tax=Paramisgurnus dabryanus TaxID=90735 RepID=UPI0031F3B13D
METQDSDVTEAVKASGESTLEKAKAKALAEFDQMLNVSLNIAITGNTGSGKSSFVNALRGLCDDDEGSAPTGVTETTMEATMYEQPGMPNVKIWDLPGIGSPNFKANKYLKDVKFDTYDFFIILSSERFHQNDIMLAKEIKKKKKNFYFVRSKIDNDISAEQRKKGFDEQKILSKIREDCKNNLKEIGNPNVFLISSFELEKYDFEKLRNTLEKELPKHKRSALLQAWPVCSAESLEEKIKFFKGLIWAASLASAGIAVVPVPGLSVACDTAMVLSFLVRCYYAFGLDDRSLSRLSEKVKVPLINYLGKSKIAAAIREKTLTRIQVSSTLAVTVTAEYVLSLVPGLGSVAAAGLSFATTMYVLREGLNELANTAREIRKVAGLDAVCDNFYSEKSGIMAECSAYMDFSKALQTLGEQDPNAAATKAKEQLDAFDNVVLNIAVTGETGTGKSAFINAFRGLGDDEDMSAPTGITKTTNDVNMYTHPTKPNVKLWDLPGIGVPNLKADQYLNEVKFEIYDLFIIISSARFKENDVFLAKEIKKKQKHFYFVRSKIDNDIYSASHRRNFNKDQVLCTIRENCCKNLKDVGNPEVFLISSYDLEKYDFQKLVDTIESELSEHKRFALVQCVPVCSLAMLEKKKKMMENIAILAALASGLGGYLSMPLLSVVVDKAVLVAFFMSCRYAFGMNDQSLEKLSEKVNKPVSLLKSPIKSPFGLALVDRLSVMPHVTMSKPVTSLNDLLDEKFIVKRSQNAAMAFTNTYTGLNKALNEMMEDMTEVLKVAGLD